MDKGIITFDCYGTLIDWESGITEIFQNLAPNRPEDDKQIFHLYDEEERRIEKLEYRPYSRVMAEAILAATRRAGINDVTMEDVEHVARNIPKWKPFPDTNRSLKQLSKNHDLGILSNIENNLLHGTMKHFPVDFQLVVTAEDVRSYKPNPPHFVIARDQIGARKWVHVAGSLYHDIQATSNLGIKSVWVNRKHVKVPIEYANSVEREVWNLDQLVQMLG